MYASTTGSEVCTKCPQGTYGTVAGATSNATCKACPSGSNNPSCWHSESINHSIHVGRMTKFGHVNILISLANMLKL